MNETINLEINNHVATVTLNRPDVFNAIDCATARALAQTLLDLGSDPAIRVVILTGAGRAFSGGGDLRHIAAHPLGAPAAFRELATYVHLAATEIRRMPKPVIAAINGVASGGGFSVALACDFRVMAASARLVQGYTSQGLSIDAGGTHTLPRLVGIARALEIAAFDEPISAERALAWGLTIRVVPDDALLAESRAMADTLARRSAHAFASVKQLITDSFDTSWETQLERERQALAACGDHPDGREGMRAFLEKRRPVYLQPEDNPPART